MCGAIPVIRRIKTNVVEIIGIIKYRMNETPSKRNIFSFVFFLLNSAKVIDMEIIEMQNAKPIIDGVKLSIFSTVINKESGIRKNVEIGFIEEEIK